MGFSDFWRGGRDRSDRDDNRWRAGDDNRSYGRPNYRGDELGFQRRGGWRQGSDYYGDNPERYDQSGYRSVRSQRDDFNDRPEYRGSEKEWRSGSNRYQSEFGGTRGGPSFNDRWQNAYGRGASSYGRSGNEQFGAGSQERDDMRGWNERVDRPGGMYGAQPGEHRGRGPRGYRRSDERIREDVCECLTDDERIDASNIEVVVKNCEVTLTGTVNSREEKRRAEDLIDRVSGVKDIHNTLRVVNEGGRIEGSTSRNEQSTTSQTSQTPDPSGQSSRH